jgi:glycosyltransferase involved in cell wall biosynthesis
LEQAYAHCHALIYPSLFEGFGYPPVEALRHSKPVLCSDVCSMPEVLGDAPIYFSPFYETGIFQAIQQLEAMDKEAYARLCTRSHQQYERIAERQKRDLVTLLDMLCTQPSNHL